MPRKLASHSPTWAAGSTDPEVSTAELETIRQILEEDDLIYLSGGNNFFPLQELHRSRAADLIRQQTDQGKP